MSFLAPWMLALGALAAVGAVALHLLSTRRPPARPLPTARFVPESEARAVARTSRPTDLLLLALRVAALLCIGAGFARPVWDGQGPALRTVWAVEWTSALADAEQLRADVLAGLGSHDTLVVFDTAARAMSREEFAALEAPGVRGARLSPMLVVATDVAPAIARGADSVALRVLSLFSGEMHDAATPALRAAWPGRANVVAVAGAVDTASASPPEVLPRDASDPLLATLPSLLQARGGHAVRIRRGAALAADSAWLAASADRVLLLWPRAALPDSALVADGVLFFEGDGPSLVAPLGRLPVGVGRVIARWRDGAPAAVERAAGGGCVREVGVALPEAGDLTLRAPFVRVLEALVTRCGGRREPPLDSAALESFAGSGPLASADAIAKAQAHSELAPWLLAAALLLLLAEQWLRRRPSEAA
ncbi:MAG: BatA domain-containing protein [Gemmatimonadaceae bacterium]|nr:BatA domain-containing protein [Gemmatimonadaceae bacterium]MCW5826128.1 BatA domain-containing protein [Gemmatimonadaceae bacterium]